MGSAKERYDRRGREKVQCRECPLWYHNLAAHIVKAHGELDGVKASDEEVLAAYKSRHPDAPLGSETAIGAQKEDDAIDPESDEGLFKFGVARLRQRELDEGEEQYIPVHDEGWVLGKDEAELLESLALGMEDDDNVLIVGPPGIGKSTLVKELAVICNQPLRRMSFRGDMRTSDLIGKSALSVQEGQTVTSYEYGVLPDAAEMGHWFLVDEIDAGPPEVMFILHPTLEQYRTLMLTGKGTGHEVDFDKRFRFIATANTLGYGDESGLYAGTGPMNEALLDRFGIVITMGYPTAENEIKRLSDPKVSNVNIAKADAEKMVEVAGKIREAQRNDTTMTSLSPRRVMAWARKSKRLGDIRKAAKLTVTNKLPADDALFVEGIIQRYFGGSV